jgi:hypothetical protein
VYTVFVPYLPSCILSLPPPSSDWYQTPHTLARTCSALFFSHFVEEKKK